MPTQSVLNLMVTTDHPVPVEPYNGTAVVQNVSGDTLYWADNPQVQASNNQGTIPGGGTFPFTSPVWVRSAGLSTVQVLSTPTTTLPVNVFSRSQLLTNNGFSANSAAIILVSDLFQNPQDMLYYLSYADASNYGLARSASPDGPWTNLGAMPGAPAVNGVQQHRLILTPDNKWSLYYVTASNGVVGLYQTAAGAAINSTYTLTNAALLSLGTSGQFDEQRCSEPFIFVDQAGTWRLLYMGMNLAANAEQTGMATASSHLGPFTKAPGGGVAIIPNGGAGTFDNTICADPQVIYYNGVYYIFYSYGGPNDVTGAACFGMALTTTTDWTTFTKRGLWFPPGKPGAGDCISAWGGNFWWKGRLAGDNSCVLPAGTDTIYYPYFGRQTTGGNPVTTQSYLAKIDPQPIFNGSALAGTPWTRVEAESGDAKLTTSGTWANVTSGTTFNRGWSGTGFTNSNTTNDFQRLSWTGTRARVWLGEANAYGIANIFLDGALVSVYDACGWVTTETSVGQVLAYSTGQLLPGPHTLTVQVTGTKNASSSNTFVVIDCWEYI